MEYPLLSQIRQPDDLKQLAPEQLPALCEEIRTLFIRTLSKTGGHLASNLGAVELTVALHRVFSSPEDAIIFDVGHQCYAHKLLTGRMDRFQTLRTEKGLSGFMRPDESPHDPIVTGHSSNSISAALGIAQGKRLSGQPGYAVAVVGDGAMTGGMIYEAMNNAGRSKENLIVVLNDNKMSIAKNLGALPRYLTVIRTRPSYYKFKRRVERIVKKLPLIGNKLYHSISHSKILLKNAIYHSNIFESFGFHYLGPVDGHDLHKLAAVLELAKQEKRPVFVHVSTVKGKGYLPAEKDPGSYHGVPAFDIETGSYPQSKATFSDVFGKLLCGQAQQNMKICAITAAMPQGTGLDAFARRFPERFFDVGIAEEHAVTFGAGLAKAGMKPVFAVYSTFLQRGYDQLIHDVAIAGLPLVLAIDRAGIVGEDGETHQGVFDAAFLNAIPHIAVYTPANFTDLRFAFDKAMEADQPVAVRYPRGGEPDLPGDYQTEDRPFVWYGDRQAGQVLITYGRLFGEACKARQALAAKGIPLAICKLNQIKPLPAELIDAIKPFSAAYFFEEGMGSGGVGEHMGSRLLGAGFTGRFRLTAIPDEFVPQSTVAAALRVYRLDAASMAEIICGGMEPCPKS
ncbi:MAG: 1-deoxy-D-xylulose-5-phosphate synthase [Clostridiales bacterium]|nr:1-deoxy-D-xylulose-5-phosphate synthase [Clostridiales bacterium]